jgi:hypothetical protein
MQDLEVGVGGEPSFAWSNGPANRALSPTGRSQERIDISMGYEAYSPRVLCKAEF